MAWSGVRKLLMLLVVGACLPVTFTCRPVIRDGVIHVITDDWWDEEIVIYDDYYGDCWNCDRDGFHFDFFGHHYED